MKNFRSIVFALILVVVAMSTSACHLAKHPAGWNVNIGGLRQNATNYEVEQILGFTDKGEAIIGKTYYTDLGSESTPLGNQAEIAEADIRGSAEGSDRPWQVILGLEGMQEQQITAIVDSVFSGLDKIKPTTPIDVVGDVVEGIASKRGVAISPEEKPIAIDGLIEELKARGLKFEEVEEDPS